MIKSYGIVLMLSNLQIGKELEHLVFQTLVGDV